MKMLGKFETNGNGQMLITLEREEAEALYSQLKDACVELGDDDTYGTLVEFRELLATFVFGTFPYY